MPGAPSCDANVDSCAARPERTTSPPWRVARDIPADSGCALRRTVIRARMSPATATSSSKRSGCSGSGRGVDSPTTSTAPDGSSSHSSRVGSSSTGRSCTSWDTSARRRPSEGRRSAASGTVTRVPDGTPVAGSSRTCMYAYGSSPVGGEEPRLHRSPVPDTLDPARALRQPHVTQPAAEQTTTTAGLGQLAEHAQAPLAPRPRSRRRRRRRS